jgi:hypothetical protein
MKLSVIILVLALAACRDQRPPVPSADESDQLNEMDNALNALGNNEEGPADRSTGPSNN